MSDYIKCPRCELNYIRREQEYCDVCKAELRIGPKLLFIDDEEDDIDAEATELCPICKQNYIRSNEEMCEACKREMDDRRDEEFDMDKDEEWRTYLEDDKDDLLDETAPDGAAYSDDEDEPETDSYTGEAETEKNDEPDDFDYGPIDEKDFSEDAEEEEDDEDDDEGDFGDL